MQLFNKKYLSIQAHAFVWIALFLYPFLFHYIPITDLRAVSRISIFLLLLISFFYFNTHVLVPKLLSRKWVVLYLLVIAGIIALIAYASGYIQLLLNPEAGNRPQVFDRAFNTGLIISFLTWVISTGLKVTGSWFQDQERMRVVETERLNAELSFLKSQVNPHFLFNALNNIYSLENKKSPDTGPAILKLSALVRYILYETPAEFVPLERELDYLKNYVELQKLGLSKSIDIDFRIDGDPGNKKIEPMLLLPLVENVFKHGISFLNDSRLSITIQIQNNRLEMITRNRIKELSGTKSPHSGIGLVNLRKRLHLLYPSSHELLITQEEGIFVTHLTLELK